MVYNKETGAVEGTYYLMSDNTISASATDSRRLLPVQTKYIGYDADKGYMPQEVATSELQGNIFCIVFNTN